MRKPSAELITRSVCASAISGARWGQDCGKPFVSYRGLRVPDFCCCLATATVRVELAHLRMEVAKF